MSGAPTSGAADLSLAGDVVLYLRQEMVQRMTGTLVQEEASAWNRLQIGGGWVEGERPERFILPAGPAKYADAQVDDYGLKRTAFRWRPGTRLEVSARFSHDAGVLRGTAGFGFWNAPFGPTTTRPRLPQAVWFFFASPPGDLPLPLEGPGRGWFASTLDAGRPGALSLAPFAPAAIALNQIWRLRRRMWPSIREQLGISFAPLAVELREWHDYTLDWRPDGCDFAVDGTMVHQTLHSPRGPLGFVCWIDNQYLVMTPRGRFRWATLALDKPQWMEIAGLTLVATS